MNCFFNHIKPDQPGNKTKTGTRYFISCVVPAPQKPAGQALNIQSMILYSARKNPPQPRKTACDSRKPVPALSPARFSRTIKTNSLWPANRLALRWNMKIQKKLLHISIKETATGWIDFQGGSIWSPLKIKRTVAVLAVVRNSQPSTPSAVLWKSAACPASPKQTPLWIFARTGLIHELSVSQSHTDTGFFHTNERAGYRSDRHALPAPVQRSHLRPRTCTRTEYQNSPGPTRTASIPASDREYTPATCSSIPAG